MKISGNLYTKSGWEIIETDFNPEQIVVSGSNFLTGNGYLGYRGTFPEWGREQFVACIVSDTYDNADGKWTELCNAPNGLYTKLLADGEELSRLPSAAKEQGPYSRTLDLRYGIIRRRDAILAKNGLKFEFETEYFSSFDDLHIIPMHYKITSDKACCLEIITGIDGQVWDLNGKHLHDFEMSETAECLALKALTGQSKVGLAVAEGHVYTGKKPVESSLIKEIDFLARKYLFQLQAGDTISLFKVMSVYSSNDRADYYTAAVNSVTSALEKGYARLVDEHKPHWDAIWDKMDIAIKGDLFSQAVLRFNLYHGIISTPLHSDNLPIGARGLSCQAYQGAAFWDQEIYNLPMFLYCWPEIARSILIYRYKTLDGARRKAQRLGYRGAFYAWVSGKSGDELCPSFFFEDVLTGRPIRNHFNDWQIHISPDIAYAVSLYCRVTGDFIFIEEYGAEMIFEIARFLYSHAYFKKEKNRYEFIRLLGPDEYHENVDNNAYTNYMAHHVLKEALAIHDRLKVDNAQRFHDIAKKISLEAGEYEQWKEMVDLLYLPQPDPEKGEIEQFDRFFDLEDIKPLDLAKRLIDKSEYWGWPNGIAVHTRVSKQADVLQLMVLLDLFSEKVVRANYNFYEPYCQHGSSLSLAMHAIIAARVGYDQEAFKYFARSCTVDLKDTNKTVSGGTFIGGIHTASCAAAWQIIVYGFAGMKISGDSLSFNPRIPEGWKELRFKLFYKGCSLVLLINQNQLEVNSDVSNVAEVTISVNSTDREIEPGSQETFYLQQD